MTENLIDAVAPVVEREAPETIPAPEIAAIEDKDVVLKQSRLNSILKDAQSRAARELRQRTAELETENSRLKSIAAGSAEGSTELQKAHAELAASKLENESIRAAAQRQAKETFISQSATAAQFIDPALVTRLVADNLRWDGKQYEVLDDAGTPRTTADGSAMTPTQFFDEYATQKPFLVKGQVKSGGGGSSSGGAPVSLTNRYDITALWGPGARPDAGRVLNEWSLRDKRGYDQARASAKSKGLVN